MNPRRLIQGIVAFAFAVLLLNTDTNHTQAASTAIGRFFAGCGYFSVDVSVSGTHDDGGGKDNFRYVVSDANNNVLYQEDATRPVNSNAGSTVVDLPYNRLNHPTKNPVTFAVIDLDNNFNPTGTLQSTSYDASCVAPSGVALQHGLYSPAKINVGVITVTTPLYQTPGAGQLSLTVEAGKKWQTIYRSADAKWEAIFVSSNDLVWIPSTTVSVDPMLLPVPPIRIDGSGLSSPAVGTISVGTAVVTTDLRLRSTPDFSSRIILVIPTNSAITVLGRNASNTFLKITFGRNSGWVLRFFTNITYAQALALPVVE